MLTGSTGFGNERLLEHVESKVSNAEMEMIRSRYSRFIQARAYDLQMTDLKNEKFYMHSEVIHDNSPDQRSAMIELEIENLNENTLVFSNRTDEEGLLAILDEYLGVDSKEKEYSKFLIKVLMDEIDMRLASDKDQNVTNKLARLGLSDSEYLTVKALPVADPLYVKLFLNGVITREQLESRRANSQRSLPCARKS